MIVPMSATGTGASIHGFSVARSIAPMACHGVAGFEAVTVEMAVTDSPFAGQSRVLILSPSAD